MLRLRRKFYDLGQAPGLRALRRRGRARVRKLGGEAAPARRRLPARPPAPRCVDAPDRAASWSSEQAAALDKVGRWLKAGEPQVFRLFGYAGVGKTTLARHIAEGAERRGGLRRLHRQGGAGAALQGLRAARPPSTR